MCTKFFAILFTVIAIIIAILVSFWHTQALNVIIFVSRFFDVMLPILAVGALFKFLFCGCCKHHHCKCEKKD